MIIKRGKEEGWLHRDVHSTQEWLSHCGVRFEAASPSILPGRGNVLVADQDVSLNSASPQALLIVPSDLVLSVDTIKEHALYDRDFRELLESLGDFGRTPRGAILSFLLFQACVSCPHWTEHIGVHCEFTEYVKTLPCEDLPTFWNEDERALLEGTTLSPAISSKLKSLRREYDNLCSSSANTKWYQSVETYLEFDDWMQVDAMFRSRALDFHGPCMIPGMDLASHASGDSTNAFYDRSGDDYRLWPIAGKSIKTGEEVTITYGDEKGACEMIFSYGFLEDTMSTAETLFLSLSIPEDDVYRAAKAQNAGCAPGFKLIDVPDDDNLASTSEHNLSADTNGVLEVETHGTTTTEKNDPGTLADNGRNSHSSVASPSGTGTSGDVDWKGDYIWLLCVNEDDGLSFEIARTVDGQEEVRAIFQGRELVHGAQDLRTRLAQSELWDVYRLRATVILQQRIFDQLQSLYSTQERVEETRHGDGAIVRTGPYELALKLRRLEFELLEKAYEYFEAQKLELAGSPVVQKYLAEMNNPSDVPAEPGDGSELVANQDVDADFS